MNESGQLLPKFVPVSWLEKAWEETLRPSSMMRLLAEDPKPEDDDPETTTGGWYS